MGTVKLNQETMKHLLCTSVVLCLLLAQVAESLFLGPVAVGVALGALAAKKGFILGALIAGGRSRGHSRYRRAPSYSPSNHYDTSSNTYYTRPTAYYYSSSQTYYRRGKRSVAEFDHEQLRRLRREAETFDYNDWILDMSSKDQDDCTKKLICELSSSSSAKKRLSDDEKTILEIFEVAVDATSSEVVFALAAEVGKKRGLKGCTTMYKRCETSTEDILTMISLEQKDMNRIQLEIEGLSQAEIEKQIEAEELDAQRKLKEAGVDTDKLWD